MLAADAAAGLAEAVLILSADGFESPGAVLADELENIMEC